MDVMATNMERCLRDALAAEPSEATDRRILDAILGGGVLSKRRRAWSWWAAAACLAIAIVGGILRYGDGPEGVAVTQSDVGDVMLEIIGMASIDEFYAFSAANEQQSVRE